jgi:hypothetical protein
MSKLTALPDLGLYTLVSLEVTSPNPPNRPSLSASCKPFAFIPEARVCQSCWRTDGLVSGPRSAFPSQATFLPQPPSASTPNILLRSLHQQPSFLPFAYTNPSYPFRLLQIRTFSVKAPQQPSWLKSVANSSSLVMVPAERLAC